MAVAREAQAAHHGGHQRVQPAQPEVAVSLGQAHPQLFGEGEGLLVVGFCLSDIGRIGVGKDDAKLVQRERLIAVVLMLQG